MCVVIGVQCLNFQQLIKEAVFNLNTPQADCTVMPDPRRHAQLADLDTDSSWLVWYTLLLRMLVLLTVAVVVSGTLSLLKFQVGQKWLDPKQNKLRYVLISMSEEQSLTRDARPFQQ